MATEKYPRVRLVVLEGCFDSVEHVVFERYGSFMAGTMYGLLTTAIAKQHDPEGIAPIKLVSEFPLDVPVAFITSEKDKEVPPQCTRNLAMELVKAGHKQVYLHTLQHSPHPQYMMYNEEDAQNYQAFVHAVYKKHSLPYIPKYAAMAKDEWIEPLTLPLDDEDNSDTTEQEIVDSLE